MHRLLCDDESVILRAAKVVIGCCCGFFACVQEDDKVTFFHVKTPSLLDWTASAVDTVVPEAMLSARASYYDEVFVAPCSLASTQPKERSLRCLQGEVPQWLPEHTQDMLRAGDLPVTSVRCVELRAGEWQQPVLRAHTETLRWLSN